MARLRKACAYRNIERPYTRKSKYRELSFVRATPTCKVVKFDTGNPNGDYDVAVDLVARQDRLMRHNSMEAGRQAANRYLEKNAGKGAYHLKLRLYPHHILRENPLASGAGADRMSTGMKKSFGKSIGLSARVFEGMRIITIRVKKQHLAIAKEAMRRYSTKLSGEFRAVVRQIDKASTKL